jgi:hypothetical protein
MFPRAKSVKHVKNFDIAVTFTNGEKHVVPLGDEIVNRAGEMVEPLKDISYFAKVFVNPECGNLEWPNGYDVDPDILYWLATGRAIRGSSDPKYQRPPQHLARKRRVAAQRRRSTKSLAG